MTTVYTGGTFDLFHAGHVFLLRECRRLGEVVAALNTDEFVAEYKGAPPVMSYDERAAVLRACRYVDRVVPNLGGADSKPAIRSVGPDVILVGQDWAARDYYEQMGFTPRWLADQDIGLFYVPHAPSGLSSTEVKRRVGAR